MYDDSTGGSFAGRNRSDIPTLNLTGEVVQIVTDQI